MFKSQQTLTIGAAALLFGLITIFSGCAGTPPNSGFLNDYSGLTEDIYGDRSLRWWEKTDFNWKQYQKIIIDPVVIYYHPKAEYRQIDPEAVTNLTDYFREVVEEELADEFQVVTEPGPDVLRIRAAITEVVPANPAINIITTAAVFVPLDMGGAAIEAEFIDSVSGEVMASMIDKKLGNPIDPRFYRGFTTLGYAKGAFSAWAVELKEALMTNP